MHPEIIEEKPLTMVEVQDELKRIKKRDEELNFRANKTEENLNSILAIDSKLGAELTKKLIGLEIPRVKEIHISKIVDTLPRSTDELKVVLQGYTITVKADNLKKIISTVNELVPVKKK
ncbi:hypothetical protein HN592_03730 [Candidatus Woesearchaeota archaeon]|jgi:DNA-directed RNA polymerase subunit F|nr:hypothetical protein [Candidatus Woesearchaeota archaeon]MBT4368323.1 hypothetical protein [Candidatus Woesearchaeota archaeon]MBT4712812.1 hypothetical protein [Candidatus Woesearchaeota archaeon]MBT6639724.1 hypothetical protein [Candidatus Woesearchaeota archaeon]MBT7133896.1 hypothetical protein [Candidatus Woesearchaeota archaeon]